MKTYIPFVNSLVATKDLLRGFYGWKCYRGRNEDYVNRTSPDHLRSGGKLKEMLFAMIALDTSGSVKQVS